MTPRILLFLAFLSATPSLASLRKQMDNPKNFPTYVYRPLDGSRTKVATYNIDGKKPSGPMQSGYIRLHAGQSEEILKWEARNSRASNVYFHIHYAISYFKWLESAANEKLALPKLPIDVRVDMKNDWAMWIKFAKEERFNTSQTFPDADPDKWDTPDEQVEMWFFVPKRGYLPKYVPTRWIPGIKNTVLGTAGFPLETARVPSIIYHEWVHVMTKPFLGIKRNTVLGEGYSDYYGSVIEGGPEMGVIEEFSTFPYEHTYGNLNPAKAKHFKEPGTFVPTLFWHLRRKYGAQRVDVLLWKALHFLNPESGLGDLPRALVKAAESVLTEQELPKLKQLLNYQFRNDPRFRRSGE